MPLTNEYERAAMLLLRAADDEALSWPARFCRDGGQRDLRCRAAARLPSHGRACGPRHTAGLRPMIPLDRRFNSETNALTTGSTIPCTTSRSLRFKTTLRSTGITVPVVTFIGEASLGDTVFFIGLLRNLAPMAEAGVPMVRSGTVGRMWQQRIPARTGLTHAELTGHLIDCRAYQGMSGASVLRSTPTRCSYCSRICRPGFANVESAAPHLVLRDDRRPL